MSSVKTGSVRAPSVYTNGDKEAPSARTASVRSASIRSKSTVRTSGTAQPLNAANLSRLETASITSSQLTGKRPPGSAYTGSVVWVTEKANMSVTTAQAVPPSTLNSFQVNDFPIPYTARSGAPVSRVVPSNQELKRSNLMDRYAGMRDPFFDATYDVGAPDPNKPKKRMEVAVVNPLIAARQAKTVQDKHKLDKEAQEALKLIHPGEPPEDILKAAERRAATKEQQRLIREERERQEAEARRQREALEAAERREAEAARKEQDRLEREARKRQEAIEREARKKQEAAEKEQRKAERRQSKVPQIVTSPEESAPTYTTGDSPTSPQIGDEVPTRIKSREDGSHLVEELPPSPERDAGDTLPSPIEGQPLTATQTQTTTHSGAFGGAAIGGAIGGAVGGAAHVRVVDPDVAPKSPTKEPGLFSRVFRRRSLRKSVDQKQIQAQGPTPAESVKAAAAAGGAAAATGAVVEHEESNEDAIVATEGTETAVKAGSVAGSGDLPDAISRPDDALSTTGNLKSAPEVPHPSTAETLEKDAPIDGPATGKADIPNAEVLSLYRNTTAEAPVSPKSAHLISAYKGPAEAEPAVSTEGSHADEPAAATEGAVEGTHADAIDKAVASQDPVQPESGQVAVHPVVLPSWGASDAASSGDTAVVAKEAEDGAVTDPKTSEEDREPVNYLPSATQLAKTASEKMKEDKTTQFPPNATA